MHLNNSEKGLCKAESIEARTISLRIFTETNEFTINLIAASARIYWTKY